LPQGILFLPRCIYDEIGKFSFLGDGHLSAEAGADIGIRGSLPAHGALVLLLFRAGYQDQAVESLITPRFDQNGSLHYGNAARVVRCESGDQFFLAAEHVWMHEQVEASQLTRIAEDLRGQCPPVDLSIRHENIPAKFLYYIMVRFSAGRQHLVAKFVGLNQEAARGGQGLAYEALSAGQSAR
jgi:hypothetical protein